MALLNWVTSHTDDFKEIGTHAVGIGEIVNKIKADFPTGDFSILSASEKEEQKASVKAIIESHLEAKGLTPDQIKAIVAWLLPLILSWLGIA